MLDWILYVLVIITTLQSRAILSTAITWKTLQIYKHFLHIYLELVVNHCDLNLKTYVFKIPSYKVICGFFRTEKKKKKVFVLWRQVLVYIIMLQINVLLKANHLLNQEEGQRNISLYISSQDKIHDLGNATQPIYIMRSDVRQGRISLLDFFFKIVTLTNHQTAKSLP